LVPFNAFLIAGSSDDSEKERPKRYSRYDEETAIDKPTNNTCNNARRNCFRVITGRVGAKCLAKASVQAVQYFPLPTRKYICTHCSQDTQTSGHAEAALPNLSSMTWRRP